MGKAKKQVAVARSDSTIKQKPIWRFDLIDRSGKFAFDLSRQDFQCREVLHIGAASNAPDRTSGVHLSLHRSRIWSK